MEGQTSHHHHHFLQKKTNSFLIVPEWSTGSIFGLTGAMLAAVAASVTYECLHEYLVHLRRTALRNETRSECCGNSVMTIGEKIGQSIIHIMKVTFAYFLMTCIMTKNIWLLIVVSVGAAVGYGVGKPLIANGIHDSVSSHGYKTANVHVVQKGHKRSERSRSWRYQPINMPSLTTRQAGEDDVFSDGAVASKRQKNCDQNPDEIIWIRRSSENIDKLVAEEVNNSDLQIASSEIQSGSSNYNTLHSDDSDPYRSLSRFKSTSKVINQSFRSYRSENSVRRQTSNASVFTPESPMTLPKRSGNVVRNSSKVSRTSSLSSGRFKPVSRQIRRHMSLRIDGE